MKFENVKRNYCVAEKAWRWKDLRIKNLKILREACQDSGPCRCVGEKVWEGECFQTFDSCKWGDPIFSFQRLKLEDVKGEIYQDVMNSSSCGSVFGFKKQHWATFSSPLRSLIVNSTRTNFSPHWKKCSFSCRPVFGLMQHWNTFVFLPWDRTP